MKNLRTAVFVKTVRIRLWVVCLLVVGGLISSFRTPTLVVTLVWLGIFAVNLAFVSRYSWADMKEFWVCRGKDLPSFCEKAQYWDTWIPPWLIISLALGAIWGFVPTVVWLLVVGAFIYTVPYIIREVKASE